MKISLSIVSVLIVASTSALAADADTTGKTDENGVFLSGTYVAQTDETKKEDTAEESAKCQQLKADINADVGVILRAGCQPSLAQMSKLMDNPLGNVAMLFTQFDWSRLNNRGIADSPQKDQYLYTGIAQFPKKLSEDWNLINRIVWTVPSVPINQDRLDEFSSQGGTIVPPGRRPPGAPIDAFGGRTTALGDSYYVGLFSPSEGITVTDEGEKFVWGGGFDLAFPTATEDVTGSGKWSGGPSGLAVFLGRKWKVGALGQHYWNFAGDSNRDDVNLTNLQYFVFYSLDETTSIGAAPNIYANWEQDSDNAFTVPLGIGITKTIQFGKVPVRFGAEMHYNVIRPKNQPGAEWNARFYIIPAVPSALFEWMQ